MKTLQDFFVTFHVVDVHYRRYDNGQLHPDENGNLVPVEADEATEVSVKAAGITRYGHAPARLGKFGVAGMIVHDGSLFYTTESRDDIREFIQRIAV